MEGFLNIYKPEGMTSANVVRIIKKALKAKKVGYIGTLDPIAKGVLPVGMEKATRIFPFLEKQDKVYDAVMTLGASTDTQDRTGKVIDSADPTGITEEQVRETLAGFVGEIQQIPPMYSAKKIDGERLYDLARQGIVVERKPITANMRSITFMSKEGADVRFIAEVSTGSYIRTLCHDVGEKLGVHAHLSDLIRIRSGAFTADTAIPLDMVRPDNIEEVREHIISLQDALALAHKVVVIQSGLDRIRNGMPLGVSEIVKFDEVKGASYVRIMTKNGVLAAIGFLEGAPLAGFPFTSIRPKKVLI